MTAAKAAGNRIKTDAAAYVPKSREDVIEAIAEIGRRQRERARIEAAMNDKVSKIKEQHEEEARPHGDEIRRLSEGIRVWCEANRGELTSGGKVKTINLASGEVRWRVRPPRVVIKVAEKVIEALKGLGLTQFIRTKEEINKEAILAEPAAVGNVKGISITQGEDFVIVPFETKLEEIA